MTEKQLPKEVADFNRKQLGDDYEKTLNELGHELCLLADLHDLKSIAKPEEPKLPIESLLRPPSYPICSQVNAEKDKRSGRIVGGMEDDIHSLLMDESSASTSSKEIFDDIAKPPSVDIVADDHSSLISSDVSESDINEYFVQFRERMSKLLLSSTNISGDGGPKHSTKPPSDVLSSTTNNDKEDHEDQEEDGDGSDDILALMDIMNIAADDPILDPLQLVKQQTESRVDEDDVEVADDDDENNIGDTENERSAEINVKKIEREVNQIIKNSSVTSRSKVAKSSVVKSEEPKFAIKLVTNTHDPQFSSKVPRMARKWPFKLDPWQEAAVVSLERGESVFVAAHTSAGKTVVAEYAVALSQRHLTRAIYTSPIKALSNQKFREFSLAFGDVGLITGDIQIKAEAACLIMTTEILRSMLYNGSEIVRELEWVIFDEVHYINDTERGVVWEEVLIMLPKHVKIVMLSATAPNSMEFAEWVGRIKNRRINVISTNKRPVPLQHFIYTGTDGKTKNNRFLIVNEEGKFLLHGYKQAIEAKKLKKEAMKGKQGGGGGHFQKGHSSVCSIALIINPVRQDEKGIWSAVISHLSTNDLLPVVVFTFSRKRCDDNAAMLTAVDLTTAVEKREIHFFFSRCVNRLKGTDKRLPQVLRMQELCLRGLAVHHSGILPILKEVVEMLFAQGFVKVLFAAETFAMGVNMPARTVVFDSMCKHDGKRRRDLEPGEYIQMAGRAGRRGLDSTGTVILLTKHSDVPESSDLVKMMLGKPSKLTSQFRVTYSMLLNLLRVEELRVEDMLQRSFTESAALRSTSDRRQQLKQVEMDISAAEPPDCNTCIDGGIKDFYRGFKQYMAGKQRLMSHLFAGNMLAKQLTPGRVILISHPEIPSFYNRAALLVKSDSGNKYLTVLIPTHDKESLKNFGDPAKDSAANPSLLTGFTPPLDWFVLASLGTQFTCPDSSSNFSTLTVANTHVTGVTSKLIKINGGAILEDIERRKQPRFRNASPDRLVSNAVRDLVQTAEAWRTRLAEFSLIEDGKDSLGFGIDAQDALSHVRRLSEKIGGFDCVHCLNFKEHLESIAHVEELRDKQAGLKYSLSPENLLLLPSYRNKLNVLKRLGYVNESGMVELKGKVACEIHQQELLITELMVENTLSPLSPAEIVAILASTTCQFKEKDVPLPTDLKNLKGITLTAAEKICKVQLEEQVEDNDLLEDLQFGLTEVVHQWAKGVPFAKIMELTNAQEGIIVRCIQRLNEVCIDVRNGARIVGDPTLGAKMEETSAAIKRDIVFAASLYTTEI